MRAWLFAALVVAGCKKEAAAPPRPVPAPEAPVNTAVQDALWKLAPDGAVAGVVISSNGLSSLESGWQYARKLIESTPELAAAAAEMNRELATVFPGGNVSLAAAGMSPAKGTAMFFLDGGELVVTPVVDREKFLSIAHGAKGSDGDTVDDLTCKPVQGFYVCAKPAALLTRLGKGAAAMTAKLKLVAARGDVEIVGEDLGPTTKQPITTAVVATLSRGAIVVRGAVQKMPAEVARKVVASGKPPRDLTQGAGFMIVNIPPFVAGERIPPQPIVPGVTAADLLGGMAGPATMTIDAGAFGADLRVPFKDPAVPRALVDHCDALPVLGMLGARPANGTCRIAVPRSGLTVDMTVDGKDLRLVSKGAPGAKVTVPAAPLARELASGDWALAMFGRGSFLGEGALPLPLDQLGYEQKLGLRFISLLNEGGLGVRVDGDTLRFVLSVRTIWSNPDDVVAKLLAIPADDILDERGVATARQIATAAPSSPFATDFKLGRAGALVPAAGLGFLAGLAVPAVMDNMKRSKQTEVSVELERLATTLKAYHAAHRTFPKGFAAPTPAKSCCEYPHAQCNDPSAWHTAIWEQLDMNLVEPHRFQYAYESNGKTFDIKAIGDLDCDGSAITYVLHGAADSVGNVTTTIIPPQPNTD